MVVLAAAAVAAFVWLAKPGPRLYPGETAALHTCRQCGGTGCEVCGGDGEVFVVSPSALRPIEVSGQVLSGGASQQRVLLRGASPEPSALGAAGARVEFTESEGARVDALSGEQGRFEVMLPPGRWTYRAEHPAHGTATGTLELAPLRKPLWLEERPWSGAVPAAGSAPALPDTGRLSLRIALSASPPR